MPKTPPTVPPATRQRLIDAAGEVFAATGFRAATIREICRRAGANVAAVNYHFRDKNELYQAVFRQAHGEAAPTFNPAKITALPTPRAQLQAFIEFFLHRLLASGRPAWHARLMAREMIEPTAALDYVVASSLQPQFAALLGIVRRALGPAPTENDIRFVGASIMAQCVFWKHAETVIKRMYPDVTYDAPGIQLLAEHITAFSWAALQGLRTAPTAPPRKRRARA